MRIVALSLVAVKFLIAAPCILCGLVTGVMGVFLGPEGLSPLPFRFRLIGFSLFIGGLAVLYPFFLTRRRGLVDRLIVILSSMPTAVLTVGMLFDYSSQTAAVIVLSLLLPLLAIEDLLLSSNLRARTEREGQKAEH